MKNKPVTYVLLVAVALVWGIIIYRVFSSLNDDPPVLTATSPQKKEALNDYAVKEDTAKLNLHYRDPFNVASPPKDTARITNHAITVKAAVEVVKKPATDWSAISYKGFIRNPESKQLIAMIRYNNQSIMLSEGQSFGPLRLVKHKGDSILIKYQGKTKYISQGQTQQTAAQ
jgi:hypothetical protein